MMNAEETTLGRKTISRTEKKGQKGTKEAIGTRERRNRREEE